MAFDLSAADKILKDMYQGPVREQLNNASFLLSRLRKTDKNFVGRKAIVPLHKGRNVGIGSRKDGGTLPTAGQQQYDNAIFRPIYHYGRLELTGPTIASTKNNEGAFIRGLNAEMKGLMIDLKQDLNRQLWHDGSGILARVDETSSDTIVTVSGTKFLQVGMLTDTIDGGASLMTGGSAANPVVSITDATTVVMTNAPGAAYASGADAFTRFGVRAGTFAQAGEMWGLEIVVSDKDPDEFTSPARGVTDNFGEINRSDAAGAFYKANVMRNGGTLRALTTDLMQEAMDRCDIASDETPGAIMTNHAIKRRYAALLVADKRYPPGGDITLDGGYKALEFNGVALVADKDASLTATPNVLQCLYFVSMGSLEMQVLEDWQWMQKDGSTLSRVANKDAYEATLFAYMNLSCDRPNANCLLADISET